MKLRTTLGIVGIAAGAGLTLAAPAAPAATTGASAPTAVTATTPPRTTGEPATLVTWRGAAASAPVVAVEQTTNRTGGIAASKRSKAARGGKSATAGKSAARWVSCWDGWRNGRTFHEICDGSAYRPYIDCTNGYRYIFGIYSGRNEFWMTCPAGSNAIWGGAYG
ncbi:hypothetical protein ACFY4C_31295 [Actinomadura viridis]|uniref:hypothetical protein n=1 Tax=Actinomadura viridis TaxID=58110 RepID=UPI0036BE079F